MIIISGQLDRSLKKIEKLFNKMAYNKIAINGKRNISYKTYEIYGDQMKSILNAANREFGIERIEDLGPEMFKKMIEKRIYNFLDGEFSESNNINSKITAMKAFVLGMKETNIYRKTKKGSQVAEFDKDEDEDEFDKLRKFVTESGVYRSGKDSTVLRAKPDQIFEVVNNTRSSGYNTINRAKAADIALLSFATGARISSCLKMRAADIDFENKTITMKEAKGGLTYFVDIDDKDVPYLKSLVKNLGPDQKLFEFTRKDVSFLSYEESRKTVHRYIQEAGADFFEVEKRKIKDSSGAEIEVDHIKKFAFHSVRKAFALKTMCKYIDKIKSQKDILEEVERLSKRDPKIKVKYERLIKKENEYQVKRNKDLIKINEDRIKDKLPPISFLPPKTEVSLRTAVIFFTSIQLGHFRKDIVSSHYCGYKEALEYKRKYQN